MPVPILLRVTPDSDGSWRVLVTTPRGRPADGIVPPDRVAEIRAAVAAWGALRPRPVLVPGQDKDWRRAEEHVSRALVHIVSASQQVTQCFAREEAHAASLRTSLVVAIDVTDPELRPIPWELLATDPHGIDLESARTGAILRLGAGRDVPPNLPEPTGVETVVWSPTPDDPVCAEVIASLGTQLRRLDLPPLRLVDPALEPPPNQDGAALVMHVVCHGRRGGDALQFLLTDGDADGASALRALGGWLDATDLVVLDVCEAGSPTEALLEHLPARLLAFGARACAAPTRRCGVRSSQAFSAGFYASFTQGRSLAEAVAAGRFSVSQLGVGHPDSRWHNHVLHVSDLQEAIKDGPRPSEWRPAGWPRPNRLAVEFLNLTREAAQRDGLGFIGLEHMAQAIMGSAGGGNFVATVRAALSSRINHVSAFKKGCVHPAGRTADDRGTPRLQGWAPRLSPGFTMEDLCRVLAADPDHIFQELSRPPLRTLVDGTPIISVVPSGGGTIDVPMWTLNPGTPDPGSISQTPLPERRLSIPATALQVVGGPEDGRVLLPMPGDWIGRWAGMTDVPWGMYETTWLVDRSLHRRHCVWVGPGRLRVDERTVRIRNGISETMEPGDVAIDSGDLICLTSATRLRGVSG